MKFTASFHAVMKTETGFEWDVFSAPKLRVTLEAANAKEAEAAVLEVLKTEAYASFVEKGKIFVPEGFAVSMSMSPVFREKKFRGFDAISKELETIIFNLKGGYPEQAGYDPMDDFNYVGSVHHY